MGNTRQLPVLITGGGRRIGLALAHHFLNQKQPVIVSYRSHYPSIDGLREAGAHCIQADFSTDEGILAFADQVKAHTDGLRAILHNASAWVPEKPGTSLAQTLNAMMQIHVNAPYLLNHALEPLLRGHGHAAGDIIHFTDYVVERGSDKHIAYAASKAALDNMTRSFARKLAPEVKVNAIAPALILFNEEDDAEYRQQALNKSLMKIAPGEKEVIELVDYLLVSCYVTGRSFAVDGGRPLC
ncbi:dihydromonapterin reductase [Yokenella regensburgei]|jgi:dihydromonapterin reductase/dihydrofolate reductase|uniref:Dihydromonapterin reductase n=1 Tax=Yokenella regensburgei TaxID=158877 RepID=A0AB38FT91_9ENTR|nr:dihydromonapterin reductase [Yokenella regensburgei]KFD20909.1 alternative dihydrofolate reductase 1 [Yokenella regensburgei ATCC 49455]QIU88991.1 dihydromonapterin reductase [Yokenella regensburgei]RKR64440.1 dihydromonapterin reductase/dihydrofolate reductase [Yokenella regensburgei]SQA61205.1 Dihydrofolate reductase folM [Yokenella regensburgei]SQA66914.1 Dihydrofolate reductase folM [Yokenella regensburgei]